MYDAREYNHSFVKGLIMARKLACLGDKTSYGEIISATASWFEGSKAIARTGDKASCSKCNGYFDILASAQDWAEERKRMRQQATECCAVAPITMFTVQPRSLPAQVLAL